MTGLLKGAALVVGAHYLRKQPLEEAHWKDFSECLNAYECIYSLDLYNWKKYEHDLWWFERKTRWTQQDTWETEEDLQALVKKEFPLGHFSAPVYNPPKWEYWPNNISKSGNRNK